MIRPDPAHEAKLQTMRASIARADAHASSTIAASRSAAAFAASRAREAKTQLAHSTLQKVDDSHRPPDKTHFLRPYSVPDKITWQLDEVRQWYDGKPPTGPGENFGPGRQGAPSLSATLTARGHHGTSVGAGSIPPGAHGAGNEAWDPFQSGYMRVRRADEAYRRSAGHEFTAEELARSTAGSKTAGVRGTARTFWMAGEGSRAHWSDRDGVLAAERQLAGRILEVTQYTPDVVQQSRPYRNRPIEGESKAGAWHRPSNAELLAAEGEKYRNLENGAVVARQRAIALRGSEPALYFGGSIPVQGAVRPIPPASMSASAGVGSGGGGGGGAGGGWAGGDGSSAIGGPTG